MKVYDKKGRIIKKGDKVKHVSCSSICPVISIVRKIKRDGFIEVDYNCGGGENDWAWLYPKNVEVIPEGVPLD